MKISQIFVSIQIVKMPRKRTKQKNSKKSNGIIKITNLAPKSFLSNALSNYKKNKELNKLKAIKLEKLKEKNQILKERKDLKVWEERLVKESNKLKFNEDELRLKEKEIRIREEAQKLEASRLVKKDEELILISKELRAKEKELKLRDETQNRRDIDLKVREEEQKNFELKEKRRK